MPKEVTHWIIAEKIFQAMLKNSNYKAAIEQHKDVYYLGAVLHDALYYYTGDNRRIKILPDQMHGSENQDTYAIITSLFQHQAGLTVNNNEIKIAFIAGILSHIETDCCFHPFIYYFTGNYYDENIAKRQVATIQHRALESLLDLHLAHGIIADKQYNLAFFVNSGLPKLGKLFKQTVMIKSLANQLNFTDLENSFENYVLARKIYNNKWLTYILMPLPTFTLY